MARHGNACGARHANACRARHANACGARRIFDGGFDHGEHHFYPNVLEGEGASTILHEHKFPHVALFYPGEPGDDVEYEVYAIRSTGEEVRLPMDAWQFVYIAAGIKHRVTMAKGKHGRFVCMFCRVGPDGIVRAAPKEAP